MILHVSTSLILSLMAFASQWSGLPIPKHYLIPQIIQTSEFPEGTNHFVKICNSCNTAAVTSDNGTIYVDMQWRADDPLSKCTLAHELTHWLQIQDIPHRLKPVSAEPPAYFVETICVMKTMHNNDELIRNLIDQAKKYGYGDYTTSVW